MRCIFFFQLNFLNVWGILAQKKSIMLALFFVNFLTFKMGDHSSSQASLVIWLPVNPSTLELAVLRKANIIFLCFLKFIYCNITFNSFHKLNYIKNDFVLTKFIITGFYQSDFIQSEVGLKENYTKWNLSFERSHTQTKRKYFAYKEMQSLRN